MDVLNEHIVAILTECKEEIQERMLSEKINATGKTSKGLQVEVYDGGVRLVETEKTPVKTLEVGRESGWVPIAPLIEWAGAKFGLGEKEAKSMAYAVRHKISIEGTERYKNPRNDIYSPAVEKAIEKINDTIGAVIEEAIKTN